MGYPSYDHLTMRPAIEQSVSRLEVLVKELREDKSNDQSVLWAGDVMGVILKLRQALE